MKKKSQCDKCTGLCCKYFALPLDTPEEKDDYEDIRWYLCHEDITVFVEKGDWYLNVTNRCRHLSGKGHQCLIYDHRPKICRKYKHADCDFIQGEYEYELHFTTDREMDEYIKVKFDNNVTEKRRIKYIKKRRSA